MNARFVTLADNIVPQKNTQRQHNNIAEPYFPPAHPLRRFECRISVQALKALSKRLMRVMEKRLREIEKFAVGFDTLMNRSLRHPSTRPSKETHLPVIAPRSVRNVFPKKKVAPRNAERSDALINAPRETPVDFTGKRLARLFVGIDQKHPLSARLIDGELFLRRKTIPLPQENAGTKSACDVDGGVFAVRIDDNNFIGESHALQAPSDIRFFVLCYNDG